MIMKLILCLGILTLYSTNACKFRKVQNGYICVCNSTHCDSIPKLKSLRIGDYQMYYTGQSKPGFNTEVGQFVYKKEIDHIIKVNTKQRYQKIIGFGGAFTDSTGVNIKSLPSAAQRSLLESYFGEDGIGYSICRVPIGGTDFSPRPYTYDDDHPNDTSLQYFKLQKEDFDYKIPFINEALKLRGSKNLKLIASAWTAPIWMKTGNFYSGYGLLKDGYYQLWTDYLLKFFDQYKLHDIKFWGMTTGNEPIDGFINEVESKINAMGWVPTKQMKWITENLGPSIHKSQHKDLKIIIHDDARITIPYVLPLMLNNEEALKYIDGVGVHWYWDDRVPPEVLQFTKTDKKQVFLLATESCIFREGLALGSWERAAAYIASIMEYLSHDFGGWIDWNMALNLAGGPTYIGYESDSPILVNASSQEFYKQPLFYAMGHFSKFIVPDSVRLETSYFSKKKDGIESMAFLRPDNLVALVIFNSGSTKTSVQIHNEGVYTDAIQVDAKSLYTVLFPTKENL